MGLWIEVSLLHGKRTGTITKVGPLLLLLLCIAQGCSPLGGPTVRTILPADKADIIDFLPDGRYIVHASPSQSSVMLLDVATGQDVALPKGVAWAGPLDNDLLYGASDTGENQYVANVQPLEAVRLGPLVGGPDSLPAYTREADSIYAIKTGIETYRLLLLERDPSGNVIGGYYVGGVRNLDTLLAGVAYKTPPPVLHCPWRERVPSPDGQYYYYIDNGLRIYSQAGELLNTDAREHSRCYGWAWDSSGVFIQERNEGLGGSIIGPLQLLLAKP
jgi:hypothetical protein